MTAYFFDTSALVKRYLPEVGTRWVRGLVDPDAGNIIVVSDITIVEVAAALAARHRIIGGISERVRDTGLALFRRHFAMEYEVIMIDRSILELAVDLTQRRRLRAYDAVQLASALTGNASSATTGLAGLTFVTADNDLVAAASSEGLPADNALLHP